MTGNVKSPATAYSLKRRKIAQPTQRMWTYLTNDVASTSSSVDSSHGKGKPKGKSKGKGKGKSLKGKPWSPGKSNPKGKSKYSSWSPKGKGMAKGNKDTRSFPQKRPHPVMHGANSSGTLDNSHVKTTSSSNTLAAPTVRCHKLGHYKSNCRQYESLRNSSAYKARLSHPARTQLICDHLEDSVFAPKSCPITSCTNSTCDGYNCYTSFPEDEFISTPGQGKANDHQLQVKVKLDSCGSVSIAHSDHLIRLKKAKDYGLQNIRLLGIGGRTNFLTEVGVLPVHKPDGDICFMLCYAFNSPLGKPTRSFY
jgi:hypothetical protein